MVRKFSLSLNFRCYPKKKKKLLENAIISFQFKLKAVKIKVLKNIFMIYGMFCAHTVKPLIKDTLKEDKTPNKGQAGSTLVYILYRKSPLKEDNLSTKDKVAGPEGVLIKRLHCIP